VDQSWEYINRSQAHECGYWDLCRAIPRNEYINGIFLAVYTYSTVDDVFNFTVKRNQDVLMRGLSGKESRKIFHSLLRGRHNFQRMKASSIRVVLTDENKSLMGGIHTCMDVVRINRQTNTIFEEEKLPYTLETKR
jgi:hypothetical protein